MAIKKLRNMQWTKGERGRGGGWHILLWMDHGHLDAVRRLEGVDAAYPAPGSKNQISLYIDPRYEVDDVMREVKKLADSKPKSWRRLEKRTDWALGPVKPMNQILVVPESEAKAAWASAGMNSVVVVFPDQEFPSAQCVAELIRSISKSRFGG